MQGALVAAVRTEASLDEAGCSVLDASAIGVRPYSMMHDMSL